MLWADFPQTALEKPDMGCHKLQSRKFFKDLVTANSCQREMNRFELVSFFPLQASLSRSANVRWSSLAEPCTPSFLPFSEEATSINNACCFAYQSSFSRTDSFFAFFDHSHLYTDSLSVLSKIKHQLYTVL
jgi:hypothetical protein